MKLIDKDEMHEMSLSELENVKDTLFLQVNENRKVIRNVLYELLGVIDFKRKIALNGS